jgi:hypothetical protein
MNNISVESVEILEYPKLAVTFNTHEKKIFDLSPYLDKGIFTELKDVSYFKRVKATNGTIEWPNGQDFCPDTLYIRGIDL